MGQKFKIVRIITPKDNKTTEDFDKEYRDWVDSGYMPTIVYPSCNIYKNPWVYQKEEDKIVAYIARNKDKGDE